LSETGLRAEGALEVEGVGLLSRGAGSKSRKEKAGDEGMGPATDIAMLYTIVMFFCYSTQRVGGKAWGEVFGNTAVKAL
jgi:hypothetical protein